VHPERVRSFGSRDLEFVASQVLLDPVSADARLALGAEFEVQLGHCALEQFLAAADLSKNPAPALGRAARATARLGDGEEAAEIESKAAALA
jgi:hypothetical protein